MKLALALFALALAPGWCQIRQQASVSQQGGAGRPPRRVVNSRDFTGLERQFDSAFESANAADPMFLLGNTSAIYIDGYGVVFSTQLDLIHTPGVSPFHLEMSDADKADVHQRKLKNLPLLRSTLSSLCKTVAAKLETVPLDRQVVVAVRVLYFPWENTAGLPGQVLARGERGAVLKGNITLEEQQ